MIEKEPFLPMVLLTRNKKIKLMWINRNSVVDFALKYKGSPVTLTMEDTGEKTEVTDFLAPLGTGEAIEEMKKGKGNY